MPRAVRRYTGFKTVFESIASRPTRAQIDSRRLTAGSRLDGVRGKNTATFSASVPTKNLTVSSSAEISGSWRTLVTSSPSVLLTHHALRSMTDTTTIIVNRNTTVKK